MDHQEQKRLADALYREFVEPLESERWGEYVAVSQGGETVVGSSLIEVAQRARVIFGPGSFLFRVGPKGLGRWRQAAG